MLPIRTYKNYWETIQVRLQIDFLFLVKSEAKFQENVASMSKSDTALVVVEPSSDITAIDNDNIINHSNCLVYVITPYSFDNSNAGDDLTISEQMQILCNKVLQTMKADSANHTILQNIHFLHYMDFNGIHIDPEFDYLGSIGYSFSFKLQQEGFMGGSDELIPLTTKVNNSDDSYHKEIEFGKSLILPDIKFKDSDGSERDIPACTDIEAIPGSGISGSVVNSDLTLNLSVPPGEQVLLEDITFKDWNGDERQVPACTNIEASIPSNSQVTNSDQSYSQSLDPEQNLELPDITVKNSVNTLLQIVSAVKNIVISDITFIDSDASSSTKPAGENITATPHHGSDVHNSDNSFTYHLADSETKQLSDVTVKNSENTTIQTVAAAKNITLADISFTDSDGSVVSKPACKNFSATPQVNTVNLEFMFPATYDNNIVVTAGANQAKTFTSNTNTNVASVVYKVNTVTKTIPFAVANGDTLEVIITKTNTALQSIVILNG